MKRNEQTNESSIKPHDNTQSLFNKHVSENKALHCFYSANTRAFDSTFLKKLHCALKIPSVLGVVLQNIFGMYCSCLRKENIFSEMPLIFKKKINLTSPRNLYVAEQQHLSSAIQNRLQSKDERKELRDEKLIYIDVILQQTLGILSRISIQVLCIINFSGQLIFVKLFMQQELFCH